MSRRKQNVVPAVPSTVPEGKAEVEAKPTPEVETNVTPEAEVDADGRRAIARSFRAFMEVSPLFAEVLERQVDLASRREAKEPDFHLEIEEEMAAWRQYRKQIFKRSLVISRP